MRALLDTCVLVPSLGRDLLLSIAVENAYVAHWSSAILDELSEVLHRRAGAKGEDPAATTAYVNHLIAEMSGAFPDALVAARYETLIGTFGLPDPDDEHVVAAAVICGAAVIVSDNVSDMPADKLPDHIEVVPAREFIHGLVNVRRDQVRRSILEMGRRHRIGFVEMVGLLEKKHWLTAQDADALRASRKRSCRGE